MCALVFFGMGAALARAQGSAPASLGDRKTPAAESPAPAVAPPKSAAPAPAKSPKKEKSDANKQPGLLGSMDQPKGPITTEIYSDQASFDSAKYIGVFTGHVIVNDPRFNVQSDKLTVFLHKGGDNGEEEGLEKAIAEGNVGVVRDRPDPKGGPPQRAIGRADKAVYTTKNGVVELTGTPRVQQGMNSHIATSADTVMLLNQAGELQTRGPSRTEIRQEPKLSPSPSGSPAAAASPSASTSASPPAKPSPTR